MDDEAIRFFKPDDPIAKSGGRLPHWEQDQSTYFLTFHVADSLPASLRGAWEAERNAWIAHNPQPWTVDIECEYHRRFSQRIERWLDQSQGACPFRAADHRAVLAEVLLHFDGIRFCLHSFVVMPNHVHVLVSLFPGVHLARTIQGWKGFASRKIRQLGRWQGELWQAGYFDRLVRDEVHFGNCVRYIRRNPAKARLAPGEYVLFESDHVKRL